MFSQLQATPYDLVFRLFGFPIRVHPFFWLVALLFGWGRLEHSFGLLAAFVGCFFVSILVHELGHAFAYRAFHRDVAIWLYGFGGLAIADGRPTTRTKRVIVSLAGPGAGFAFLGLIIGSNIAFEWAEDNLTLALVYHDLVFMNLWWNVLNLIPVYPLDGGQVSRELFTASSPWNGVRNSLYLSLGLAIVLAVHGAMTEYGQVLIPYLPVGGFFMAILFGMLAFENYQLLQQTAKSDRWNDGPRWG